MKGVFVYSFKNNLAPNSGQCILNVIIIVNTSITTLTFDVQIVMTYYGWFSHDFHIIDLR